MVVVLASVVVGNEVVVAMVLAGGVVAGTVGLVVGSAAVTTGCRKTNIENGLIIDRNIDSSVHFLYSEHF